jgi:hypothetical protein
MKTFLIIMLVLLAGCARVRVEGDCVYMREVKATYQCERDGKIESIKVQPLPPE